MKTKLHLAHYHRWHWEKPDLIVVTGEAENIWKGRRDYCRRHGIPEPDSRDSIMLDRLFASAGLAAVSLPEPEWWGWSVTFSGISTGLFCGVEPEGMVCGTVRISDPSLSLVAVQRQSKRTPVTQSRFTLVTHDPVEAVERYFEEAEQSLIRIAVEKNGRCTMLRPMPGGRFDDIEGLSDEELIARCFNMAEGGELKSLDEVLLFYECPCDSGQIKRMLEGLPEEQKTELWADLDSLDVLCPRCGRKYTVPRV